MERKTAAELKDLVQAEARRRGIYCFIDVHECPQLGWRAQSMTAPAQVARVDYEIEQIATELRKHYALPPPA